MSSLEIRYRRIEVLAYRFWEIRGRPSGTAEDDWFAAELFYVRLEGPLQLALPPFTADTDEKLDS